jgi:cytidine deaminase, homotetrameric/phosphopentomutase
MNPFKRIFLIVLDSLGAGELPDAADFGDKGAHTLRSLSHSDKLFIPNLRRLGIGNIEGLGFLGTTDFPEAAVCKLAEHSNGKDSTIGHWEMSGVISDSPLPTFPDGFPEEIITEFSRVTGRSVLCNKPYSGTKVIEDYGEEHMSTGSLIVYTSADSVFQIAAHEDVVPLEELYRYCREARKMLTGRFGVGRVIARPFTGQPGCFTRTPHRHDFSIEPPEETMLDAIKAAGLDVISVGKIQDLFAGRGLSETHPTSGNAEGMAVTSQTAEKDFTGLCFVNLVDFDMLYGHRQDVDGYAKALSEFDRWLGGFLLKLKDDDLLLLTADHGCDPCDDSTDHTREYIPLLAYGNKILSHNLGVRHSFADIAATVTGALGVKYTCEGKSMLREMTDIRAFLREEAIRAMNHSYSPYSGFRVGAALLAEDGEKRRVFTGCNLENAAYSPTICAERTAFAKALSEGERHFRMIAIAGGKNGVISGICPPCGVCRQVMSEFCSPDFEILLVTPDGYEVHTFSELVPYGFAL